MRDEARWWLDTAQGESRKSRYPNGLGGDPTHYYDEELARECVKHAEAILGFALTQLTPGA